MELEPPGLGATEPDRARGKNGNMLKRDGLFHVKHRRSDEVDGIERSRGLFARSEIEDELAGATDHGGGNVSRETSGAGKPNIIVGLGGFLVGV